MLKNKIKQFEGKVKKEALLNSFLYSLFISFCISFILSFIFWICLPEYFWISIIVLIILLSILPPLVYNIKYKVKDLMVAERLDSTLNADARCITALQYKEKEEFIYKAQRKETKSFLVSKQMPAFKYLISAQLIIILITSFILFAGMTSVSAITAAGYMKSGNEIINNITKENLPVYEITYKTCYFGMSTSGNSFFFEQDENKLCGEIIGSTEQIVMEGDSTEEVMAVAYDGYMFYKWSDGSQDPVRADYKIAGTQTFTAFFVKVDEDGDSDRNGKPSDDDAEPDDENDGEPGSDHEGSGSKDGTSTENKSDLRNQVLDGKTYYGGKTYEEARKDSSDKASKDGDMSDSMKKLINDYFDAIKKK